MCKDPGRSIMWRFSCIGDGALKNQLELERLLHINIKEVTIIIFSGSCLQEIQSIHSE